jgi:hypothetical protein
MPLTNISDVSKYLAKQNGTFTDPVALSVQMDLGTMTAANSGWKELLNALSAADKYVALDLSACTMNGTEFNPDNRVTAGKNRIVSITLPDNAASIADGTGYSNVTFDQFGSLSGVSGAKINTVGNYAFYNCQLLANVNLPVATAIGVSAFYFCQSLTNVNLPAATVIDDWAFDSCRLLADVNLPAATTIGNYVFLGCTALASIDLPAATAIGNYAFLGCTALTSVSLPAATAIGNYAFNGCTGLVSVSLPAATAIGNYAFNSSTELVSVSLPAVTAIGNYAFLGCAALTSVEIPSITSLDSSVFESTRTPSLTVIMGPSAPALGINTFNNITTAKNVTVKIPAGATGYDDNWGNGFRGRGWNENNYLNDTLNDNINLTIEYTEDK